MFHAIVKDTGESIILPLFSGDMVWLFGCSRQRNLKCDMCGEDLMLCAGLRRQAHFAHYPLDKVDCYYRSLSFSRLYELQVVPLLPKDESNRRDVFLAGEELDQLENLFSRVRARSRLYELRERKRHKEIATEPFQEIEIVCKWCNRHTIDWIICDNASTCIGTCRQCFYIQHPESNPAFVPTEDGLVCQRCGVIDDPDENGKCKHCCSNPISS